MWLIPWIIAAFYNAVMDILENENFSSSVFKHKDPKFWYKRESWKHAKKIFGWKFDAWHLAKFSMILWILVAITTYGAAPRWHFGPWVDFIAGGLIWNLSFSLFYKLLKT